MVILQKKVYTGELFGNVRGKHHKIAVTWSSGRGVDDRTCVATAVNFDIFGVIWTTFLHVGQSKTQIVFFCKNNGVNET